jgi:hypothetical protein
VFDSKATLELDGVHYISRERVDLADLRNNPVWPRYQTLLVNMSQPVQAVSGRWLQLARIVHG